jgi:hypothetical protein
VERGSRADASPTSSAQMTYVLAPTNPLRRPDLTAFLAASSLVSEGAGGAHQTVSGFAPPKTSEVFETWEVS